MRSIIMTGGTAGIGSAAADFIRQQSDMRLLVGARSRPGPDQQTLPLDLASLADVREFVAAAEKWLDDASLDGLILNAGVQFSDASRRTVDGFEATFAVNHLAHYLLLRLLMPKLATGAIVIFTTSNLHDSRTNAVAPPEHADAIKLARGELASDGTGGTRTGLRAYASSKLCNILTARHIQISQLAQRRQIQVIAYNPGFTPGTGLTRNHPAAFKIPFAIVTSLVSRVRRMNTVSGGGTCLAKLALGQIFPPTDRFYASQVHRELTWPDPSELVCDDSVVDRLWHDSAAMVGLSDQSG